MPFISLYRRWCLQCGRETYHVGACPPQGRCGDCNGNLMVEHEGRRETVEPVPWPKSRLGRPPAVRLVA